MNHELRMLVDLGKLSRDHIGQSILDRMDKQTKDEEIKWKTPMSRIRDLRQSQR